MADSPVTVEARLDEPLSRWLWIVKWLLAIPHYAVVAVFLGGGFAVGRTTDNRTWGEFGLVDVLVLIAAIALIFTGHYPASIFSLVIGLHRWALRVAAYAALMTDAYPPFRLDQGASEPRRPEVTDTGGPDQATLE